MPDILSTANAPGVLDDRIRALDETAFVLEFIDKSDARRQRYVPIWDEVLQNYMVNPFGESGMVMTHTRQGTVVPAWSVMASKSGRSTLKDPETYQMIESISSQAITLLLGGRDIITATPIGRDDPEKARLIARLLMAVLSQPGEWRTYYQLIKDAFLFGTAYVEIGWETRSRWQYVPEGSDLVPREVVHRDAPLVRAVDIYDFYPDPSGTRIQKDMIGVAKRFRITAQEALRLAAAGIYDSDDVRLAIGRAIDARDARNRQRRNDTRPQNPRRFGGEPSDLPDRMMLLDGFEYWGESPVRMPDRIAHRVITLLNGVRCRTRGIPYLDGNIPFKEIVVNPIAGRHYGLSPAEAMRFLQDSTDALLMAFTDLVARAVKAPMLVGNSWGGNPQQLAEGDPFIFCADVNQTKPVEFAPNILQFCMAEIARRKMTMREAAGDTNPLDRIGAPRQAATTTSEIVRLAGQRVEPMVQLIERDDMPWIGRTLHSRIRQFAPEGGVIMASLNGETFEVPIEAIDIDADVRFNGARTAGSKFQQMAQWRDMAATLGSPAGRNLLLTFPEILVRMFRDGSDIPDAEDIVMNGQQRTMALMQVEAAQAAAGQAAKGGGEGPPAPGKEASFGTETGQTEREGRRIA